MVLPLVCLVMVYVTVGNGLGLDKETWPWKDFDKKTGKPVHHFPPWTSILFIENDKKKTCAGAFVVSNDQHEKIDIILTSRSCATQLKPKESLATLGGTNGQFGNYLETVTVRKVHELKCFPNNEYSDGFAILKVDPIKFDKLKFIYPIRLAVRMEQLSDSGVTVGYSTYYKYMFGAQRSTNVADYRVMLADISASDSNVQVKFPPHKTISANVSLLLPHFHVHNIHSGMPIATQNEHGEWLLRGIRAVGYQNIFMRVDQCLEEIQDTVKEMTSVGKGFMNKISKVIPCVGQSCTKE